MCGRSYARHGIKLGTRRRSWGSHGRKLHAEHGHRLGHLFGLDEEKMSPRVRVVVALAVLAPVALSGLVLAFTPVWWIFTTYFWIVFPALGLLVRGVAGLGEARPARVTEKDRERELLRVLREHGEVSPALAAMESSLPVAEADRRLRVLAEGGHLDVRVRDGGIFYALWEAVPDESHELTVGRSAVEEATSAQIAAADPMTCEPTRRETT
jgi:hypothetical protein